MNVMESKAEQCILEDPPASKNGGDKLAHAVTDKILFDALGMSPADFIHLCRRTLSTSQTEEVAINLFNTERFLLECCQILSDPPAQVPEYLNIQAITEKSAKKKFV